MIKKFGGDFVPEALPEGLQRPRIPSWKNRAPYGRAFFTQNSILNIKTATAKSTWNLSWG